MNSIILKLFLLTFIGLNFGLLQAQEYCTASGDTSYEWIESTQISTFTFTTENNGGYNDNTDIPIPVDASVPLEYVLTPSFADTSRNEYWRIWIDTNNDFTFNNTDELFFESPIAVDNAITGTLDLSAIPTGEYRMRIAMKYAGVLADGTMDDTAPNACDTMNFGEVEDFMLSVTATENLVPIANFTADTTTGEAPLTVSFEDMSNNSPTAWTWLFTGATPASSSEQNPTVVYETAGVYNVTLTVSNEEGENTLTQEEYITVTASTVAPVTSFTADTTVGEAPLTVNFEDTSTNTPTTWTWIFPGGNPTSSTEPNPVVTYEFAGTYSAILTTSNSAGMSTANIVDYIVVVDEFVAPVADFTADITEGVAPLTVNFTDLSENLPSSWSWSFNGGIASSETEQNPTVTYETAGIYDVALTVSNELGTDIAVKQSYIIVNDPANAPVADFMADITQGYAPLTVSFSDLTTNNPTAWTWLLPGAAPTNSTQQNPTVTYNTPGVYNVILTSSNESGTNTVNKENFIVILEEGQMPTPTIMTDNELLCMNGTGEPNQATLTTSGLTNGGDFIYQWQINGVNIDTENGGGSEDSLTVVIQGDYSLILLDDAGNESEVSNIITIEYIDCSEGTMTPVVDFSADVYEGQAPLTINFTDESTNEPTAWSWSFEGGIPDTSTEQNPSIVYNTAGVYSVSLTASNTAGVNTVTKTDIIVIEETTSISIGSVLDNNLMFSIFPNPTEGELTIALENFESKTVQISIFNINGQMVYNSQTITGSQTRVVPIDLKQLATGIYTVQLQSNGRMMSQKLVKL